jgi:hypothetical protein
MLFLLLGISFFVSYMIRFFIKKDKGDIIISFLLLIFFSLISFVGYGPVTKIEVTYEKIIPIDNCYVYNGILKTENDNTYNLDSSILGNIKVSELTSTPYIRIEKKYRKISLWAMDARTRQKETLILSKDNQ